MKASATMHRCRIARRDPVLIVELHLLDTGHFALEDNSHEIARLMLDFLGKTLTHR